MLSALLPSSAVAHATDSHLLLFSTSLTMYFDAGINCSSPMARLIASNQLANSYMAFNTNYHDSGLFGVYAVADKHAELSDLAWVIMHEISKMAYNVGEEDIIRARNQLKASLLFAQDGPTGTTCPIRLLLGMAASKLASGRGSIASENEAYSGARTCSLLHDEACMLAATCFWDQLTGRLLCAAHQHSLMQRLAGCIRR